MHNLVELKYTYEEISYTITKNSVEAFELLLEHVKPEDSNNDFEVNNIYNYQQLTNFVGCNISPSVLMSLVRRGLLYCDGKMNKRNYYATAFKKAHGEMYKEYTKQVSSRRFAIC